MQHYFSELFTALGKGWNRFWFTPADPFPSSLLRIAVGLIGLYYQLSFTPDLVRWFGPDGLLPQPVMQQLLGTETYRTSHPSIFWLGDSPEFLWAVHGVSTLILLAWTVGFWSRCSNLLSVAVVLSYVHRAPLIAGQLEPVLTMLMLYLCFTDSGRYLSLDRWWAARRAPGQALPARTAPCESRWTNLGLRLIQVHLAGFYLVLALNKLAGEPWWTGEAMWWLIAHTESRVVNLTALHAFPVVVNAWTHGVVLLEGVYPLLIWHRLARPLLVVLTAVHWLLFALVSGHIAFCLLMIGANAAFLGSACKPASAG